MGVQARVVLYAADEVAAQRGFDAAYAEIGRLEALLSDYRPSSELSRLNAAAGSGEWLPVSADTERVLRTGRAISQETRGAFDMTVGPLVEVWRAARKEGRLPDGKVILEAKRLVNTSAIGLRDGAARLGERGMRLDPGAIAKGDAAHHAVMAARAEGVRSVLVALAGDIAAGDAPPGEEAWRVDVKVEGAELALVRLANACVSTTGDTEQFIEIDGVRYSHVIDPRTGWGVTHRMAATVVADDGATADALSTALTVMTPEEAVEFARRRAGVSVLLHRVGSDGQGETWVFDESGRIERELREKKASRHEASRHQVTERVR